MQYTRIETTDVEVSRICLGTAFRSEGDEATCVAAIQQAAIPGLQLSRRRELLSRRILRADHRQGNPEPARAVRREHQGRLAEVRIYNQALAAAAIKDHYTQGNSAVPGRSSSERK